MKPPIVDPPNKGHNRNNLSIKDTSQMFTLLIPFKEGTTSYKRQNGCWSQGVLYSEISLY